MSKILFIQPDSIIASHLRQNGAARSFGAIGEISMPDFSAISFDGGAYGVDCVVLGS